MPLSLKDLQAIPNAAQPTAGQGLTLDYNGLLPPNVLAPTPTDQYVLVWDDTLKRPKWAQLTSAGILDGTIVNADVSASAALGISKLAGYPTDATKFLRGDGTWAVVSSGDCVRIYDNLLAADATNFDITSISQSYKHLLILMSLRAGDDAVVTDSVLMRLNGDTNTANYYDSLMQENAASALNGGGPETTNGRWSIGLCPGASSEAHAFNSGRLHLLNYTDAAVFRTAQWESSSMGGTSEYWVRNGGGMWRNSVDSVSQITLLPNTGSKWKIGSRVTIYGLN